MKHFVDGDQLCITLDDFVNLQESPVVFYSLDSEIAKTVLAAGITALTVGDLMHIYNTLIAEGKVINILRQAARSHNELDKSQGLPSCPVQHQECDTD